MKRYPSARVVFVILACAAPALAGVGKVDVSVPLNPSGNSVVGSVAGKVDAQAMTARSVNFNGPAASLTTARTFNPATVGAALEGVVVRGAPSPTVTGAAAGAAVSPAPAPGLPVAPATPGRAAGPQGEQKDAATARALLEHGALAADGARDSLGHGDAGRAVGQGREQFDLSRAVSDGSGGDDGLAPPGSGGGGGRDGGGDGRRDFVRALKRLGLPDATIAVLKEASTPEGRRVASVAAAFVSDRGGELSHAEKIGLLSAALLRGVPDERAEPALAAVFGASPQGRDLALAIRNPAAFPAGSRGWAAAWASRLDLYDAFVSARSDPAKLGPLTQSVHYPYLPRAERDATAETLAFHSGPAVAGRAPDSAPTRGPPQTETVERLLRRSLAEGDLDAAQVEEWTKVVYRDGLLGLRNRVDLDEHLPELVAKSKTLIVFKLDFLKEINDTFGHELGNEALRKLAAIAARGLPAEALFRRSPTGFAILTDAGPDEARTLAESDARLMAEALRGLVDAKIGSSEKALGRRVNGVDWGGTISVGVAAFSHQGAAEDDYARTLSEAEDSRIFAKDIGGGNRVAVFEGAPRMMERAEIEATLERLRDLRPDAAQTLAEANATELRNLEADHSAASKLKEPVPTMLARVKSASLRQRLFDAVYLDRLSGLRNRRWLFDHLKDLFKPGATRAYIALDIDKFGVLNAKVGEEKADLVLQELGGVMNDAVRGQDATVLHLSGEEFVVLAGPGLKDAAALGETLRRTVEAELGRRAAARGVVDPETGAALKVTISVGAASVPQEAGGPEPMLTLATAMAESMLQRAKARGRNQVVVDGAPVSAAELMSKLSRLIRIDETIRGVIANVIAPTKTSSKPSVFDNKYKTRAEVFKLLGFNPWWRVFTGRGEHLSVGGKAAAVARVRGDDGESVVVKIAAEPMAQNELVVRGLVDAFESFNGALASPRAVAYKSLVGAPVLVMADTPNRHPDMDSAHLPAAHKTALALLALTFGVTFDPGAFLDVDWGKTTVTGFSEARARTSPGSPNRSDDLSKTPWVSAYYLNELDDYKPALAKWRAAFKNDLAKTEIASILRRNGVPEARVAADLNLFADNLSEGRLEAVLQADIDRANRAFLKSAADAGLDAHQTETLSFINHAAHQSALGGAMRDLVRRLNGDARKNPPMHLEPAELKKLAANPEAFTKKALLELVDAANEGTLHRRDGERLSERQAIDAFNSLMLHATGAVLK